MNALVLYVGTQAITYIHSKSGTPSMSTITHSSHMDIFQNLAVDLDTEGINKSYNGFNNYDLLNGKSGEGVRKAQVVRAKIKCLP